ncbi:MAG: hypothetical protein MK073_06090 [Phycisphaerales bacterium]|nr:hypothetical protein [Phycisphaerales bacterium]
MKGISIIVVLSIVWSIISAIIEKRKAAEKKAALKQSPTQASLKTQEVFKADPAQVKIERLRRRKRATRPQPVVQQEVAPVKAKPKRTPVQQPFIQPIQNEPLIERITPLHQEDCELKPLKRSKKRSSRSSKQLSEMLKKRKNLKTAIVLSEVLGKPIAKRA